jgi:hypothetical protein
MALASCAYAAVIDVATINANKTAARI